MADYRFRGGNYRSGRINKRSSRGGRSYGPPYQYGGAMIPSSRLRMDEDVRMNGSNQESDQSHSSQHRRHDNEFRRDNRDRRRRRPQVVSNTGRAVLQRLGLPTQLGHGQGNRVNDMNDWYKIMVIKGKNFSREFILTAINNLTEVKFEPINFHEDGNHAVFFVKGKRVANDIAGTSDRITLPDGSKMAVRTQRLQSRPATILTPEVLEKLKLCMNKRYDISTCSLNLTDLCNDDDMQKEELSLDLRLNTVVERVLNIIAEYIPELKGLNLSKNNLSSLKAFSTLAEKAPQLTRLFLTNNRLQSEKELQHVQKLPIEELNLDENPLCRAFEDKQSYVRAIRKILPKVERLDGHVLPPPITFDVDTPTTLPVAQGSHFINDQYKGIICQFINWYYAIYDSDNRQHLLEAYHAEVMFSMSYYSSRLMNRSTVWADYQANDRNLKSIRDPQKRQMHLKRGGLDVVSLLSKLPATQHSPDSFVVDVNIATPIMLTFTIHGVYRERVGKPNTKQARKFSRTFVTIPSSSELRLAVINEMFNVTVASPSANEKYFPVAASTSFSSAPAPDATTTTTNNSELTEIQLQMVQQFSAQSGMNAIWSARCLSESGWNYERAAEIFVEANARQAIPPEAFQCT